MKHKQPTLFIRTNRRLLVLLPVLYCLSILPLNLQAKTDTSAEQTKTELSSIAKEINSLKANLSTKKTNINKVTNELKSTEVKLGKINKDLDATHKKVTQAETKLKKLEQEKSHIEKKLQQQLNVLSKQLKANYYLGEQNYLKMLLTPSESDKFSEDFEYYRYIHQSRLNIITEIKSSMTELTTTQKSIQDETTTLEGLLKTKLNEQNTLKELNVTRNKTLKSLNKEIKSNQSKMAQLIEEKNNLEKILKQLDKASKKKPTQTTMDFAKAKGKLTWPVKGKISQAFGSIIPNTNVKSNGVFINAKIGQNVNVIAQGQVIFADWLKGYGLLTIVDHGQGYMSLYGHNRSIYTQVGDSVATGTVIAKVGESGGLNKSGLYFEIRHNGKPVNPQRWCQ